MKTSKSSNEVSIENRLEWVDMCRGIGMLLVLIGHFFAPTRPIIYTFHMPLFFFLSGYVTKTQNGVGSSILKHSKKLLLPYAVTSAVIVFVLVGLSIIKSTFSMRTVTDALIRCFYGIAGDHEKVEYLKIPMVGSLWFLQAMFWGGIINDALSKLSKQIILCYSLLIILCLVTYFTSLYIWLPTNIQSGAFCAIFIFLGHRFRSKYDQLEQKLNSSYSKTKDTLGICGLVCGVVLFFISNYLYDSVYPIYGLLIFPLHGLDFLFCISGCVFVVCASVFLCRTTILKYALNNIGKYSLYVLCVHSVDRFYLQSLWGIVGKNIFITLFRIILTLALAILIGKCIEKRKTVIVGGIQNGKKD